MSREQEDKLRMYEQQIAMMQQQMDAMQKMLGNMQKENVEKINLEENMPLNTARRNAVVNDHLDFTSSLNKMMEEKQKNMITQEEALFQKINMRAMQMATVIKQSIIDKVAEDKIEYYGQFERPGGGLVFKKYACASHYMANMDMEDYLGNISFKYDGKNQCYNFTNQQSKIFERCIAIIEEDGIKHEYDRYEVKGFLTSSYKLRGIKFYKELGKV